MITNALITRLRTWLSRTRSISRTPNWYGSREELAASTTLLAVLSTLVCLAWLTFEIAESERSLTIAGVALAELALGITFLALGERRFLPRAAIGSAYTVLGSFAIALDFDNWTLGFLLLFLATLHTAYTASPRGALVQVAIASAGMMGAGVRNGFGTDAIVDWATVTILLALFSLATHAARAQLERLVGDLRVRAEEQRVVARLGQQALAQHDLDAVMGDAAKFVAETTRLERVVIFEILPGKGAFLTRACVGPLGDDDQSSLTLGSDSFANYTLLADEPVVVDVLEHERRFAPTPILLERGIVSAANVVVPGRNHPWGVLGVRTTQRRAFRQDETDFLQAVANVLGATIELREDAAELERGSAAASELNERLSAVIDASPISVIEIDLHRRVQIWNRAAEETFGWTREEVLGDLLPVLPEERIEELMQLIDRVAAGEPVINYETERKRRDGSVFPYALSLAAHRDSSGKVIGIIGMGADLSEHKLAAEQLSRTRELYRVVVENSHDMIAVLDPLGRFVFASPSYEEILGYRPDELTDVSPISLVHPSDVQRASDGLRKIVTGEGTELVELRMRHKRGSWVFVEGTMTAIRDDGGRLGSILMSFRDISERRTAEEELREAEARYRLLVEQLPLVTYINAPGQGRWVYLSPQLEEIIGYQPSEWTSSYETYIDAIHPEDRERVVAEREASSSKGRFALEYRINAKSGRTVWIRDEAVVVRDLSGRPLYTQGYLLDITPEQEAEVERKRLEAQLLHSQKMEAVGRLAGGIAHDFNNLLTAITGYSELIVSELDPSSSLARDAEEIKRAAEQAAAMTQQLLTFSRRQVVQPTTLDTSDIVEHMRVMLQRLIGEDIELVTELGQEISPVHSDRGQLEQVIMNLVVNARDAMPNGGRITIHTENTKLRSKKADELGLTAGDYVQLTISDLGTGMDSETISHVFEPFFTTKEQGKGTGLGLATVHGIIEQANGSIEVESLLGEGTTFHIYLPATPREAAEEQPVRSPGKTRGSETLLLVEDEEMVRQLVGRVLRELGYDVYEASSGDEALTLSGNLDRSIDLLVTDVVMPGMSGRELAEQIAQSRPTTRILFMSGYTEEAIVHHGVLSGEAEFIGKPFTPQELAQKIRDVLGARTDGSARSKAATE